MAIIDTGIDSSHPLIIPHLPRVKERLSFLPNHPETEDTHGHGTYLAHILLKTATRAHVFIARAFVDGREGEMEKNSQCIANVGLLSFSLPMYEH